MLSFIPLPIRRPAKVNISSLQTYGIGEYNESVRRLVIGCCTVFSPTVAPQILGITLDSQQEWAFVLYALDAFYSLCNIA
jgi:hypothetical protein